MGTETEMRDNVAAFEQTVRSTIELAAGLGRADWELPTDCPGWTVKDQLAHLVGVERSMLGDPEPARPAPDGLPYLRNDFARMLEAAVELRRPVPGPEVLAELRETLDRRLAALPEIDPDSQVLCPDGKMGSYARMMMFRAFDCWIHEQDIRRAVGRPGNLDAPAGGCARTILESGLPYVVARRAQAAPGQSVAFRISGPRAYRVCVLVGDDGRGRAVPAVPEPTVTLGMGWETYIRLAAGRCGPAEVQVAVQGDPALAGRVLDVMAVTP